MGIISAESFENVKGKLLKRQAFDATSASYIENIEDLDGLTCKGVETMYHERIKAYEKV
jgi:hypothetical protein